MRARELKPGKKHELDPHPRCSWARPRLRFPHYTKSFPMRVTSPLQDSEPNRCAYLSSPGWIFETACQSDRAEPARPVSITSPLLDLLWVSVTGRGRLGVVGLLLGSRRPAGGAARPGCRSTESPAAPAAYNGGSCNVRLV